MKHGADVCTFHDLIFQDGAVPNDRHLLLVHHGFLHIPYHLHAYEHVCSVSGLLPTPIEKIWPIFYFSPLTCGAKVPQILRNVPKVDEWLLFWAKAITFRA